MILLVLTHDLATILLVRELFHRARQNQLHSIAHNLSLDIPVFHKHRLRINILIRNQLCDLSLIRFGVFPNLRKVLAEPVNQNIGIIVLIDRAAELVIDRYAFKSSGRLRNESFSTSIYSGPR